MKQDMQIRMDERNCLGKFVWTRAQKHAQYILLMNKSEYM